ncbi:MAG: hypothetical protein K5907_08030 [Treponema sp.]|nr:hypothetical protein [Treponema sp.]
MEYVAEESFLLVEKMQKCANVYKATSTHLCLNRPECCFYEVETPMAVHINFRQH